MKITSNKFTRFAVSTALLVLTSTMANAAPPMKGGPGTTNQDATSLEAKFDMGEDGKKISVNFTFENKTHKPMYITDDLSPEVHNARFEPVDTCVLVSKLRKPTPPAEDIPVLATRVAPGKKYTNTLTWTLPLKHAGELPKGWSKDDKPQCHNLRFEIAAIPDYKDLAPEEAAGTNGKKMFRLSKEARRHQETQTAEAENMEIGIDLTSADHAAAPSVPVSN